MDRQEASIPGNLSRADLEGALDALGAISESASSTAAFARDGLACLRRLVPGDLATLSVCDLATGHRSVVADVPGAIPRAGIEAFDRHFHEHPLVRAHGRNPGAVTRRVSDLVPRAQFRRSAIFNEY